MKDNTRVIKCRCCEKELETYNKEVEKESYGYIYSVDYYKELETFLCEGAGEKKFGQYFCNDCLKDMDESIRKVELKEGQDFIDNLDINKQKVEKELLDKIEQLKQEYLNKVKELDKRAKKVKKYIKDIKTAKDIKSIKFKELNIMKDDYPSKLRILSDYKKSFPVTPLNRTSEGKIYEVGICPTCGERVANNFPYDRYCNHCLQKLKWD